MKIGNGPIIGAIVSTLLWDIAYFTFFPWYVALLLFFAHPVIGWLFSLLVEFLCICIDQVYELDQNHAWGGWIPELRIIFAAWWPISGPIGILVTGIGVLYGAFYRLLFDKID
jgi:hypothetical protein